MVMIENDLIDSAIRLLSVYDIVEDIPVSSRDKSRKIFQAMLKSWFKKPGQELLNEDVTVALLAGQASFEISKETGADINDSCMRISEISHDTRRNIKPLGLPKFKIRQYNTSPGIPVVMYEDKKYGKTTVHVHPIPDEDIELRVSYYRQLIMAAVGTDPVLLNDEWELAITHGAALLLAPIFGVPLDSIQSIAAIAMQEKKECFAMGVKQIAINFGR